jgi:hypothetical protein
MHVNSISPQEVLGNYGSSISIDPAFFAAIKHKTFEDLYFIAHSHQLDSLGRSRFHFFGKRPSDVLTMPVQSWPHSKIASATLTDENQETQPTQFWRCLLSLCPQLSVTMVALTVQEAVAPRYCAHFCLSFLNI